MIVRIQDIKVGDTIKESRGNGFTVEHLDFLSCSSGGVHVNGKYCYEWNDQVARKDVVRDDDHRLEADFVDAVLHGELEVPAPDRNGQFSDKALSDRLRRQARERAYA